MLTQNHGYLQCCLPRWCKKTQIQCKYWCRGFGCVWHLASSRRPALAASLVCEAWRSSTITKNPPNVHIFSAYQHPKNHPDPEVCWVASLHCIRFACTRPTGTGPGLTGPAWPEGGRFAGGQLPLGAEAFRFFCWILGGVCMRPWFLRGKFRRVLGHMSSGQKYMSN